MADIFLSYSHDDYGLAEALAIALTDYGWSVWFDRSGLQKGGAFDEQIENAIASSRVTLVIWSKTSVKSRWVRAEASYAFDRTSLVPVLADDADPPLQFLHLQGFSFAGWRQGPEELPIRQLAAFLSKQLDRDIAAQRPQGNAIAKPASADDVAALVARLKLLLFPAVGDGFADYFRQRTFFITQCAVAIIFFAYTLNGLVDLFGVGGGIGSTRFRFMVGDPAFIILLGLSFTGLARRYSQTFTAVFGVAGVLIVFSTVRILERESAYGPLNGMPTLAFMMVLAFGALVPFRFVPALAVAVFIVALHTLFIDSGLPGYLFWGFMVSAVSSAVACLCIAYFREWSLRKSFLEQQTAQARIEELKERLLAMAAQRGRAPGG